MSKLKFDNMKGQTLGHLDTTSGRVLDNKNNVLFYLNGNRLTSAKSGKEYAVLADGRVLNNEGAQMGIIYGFDAAQKASGSYASGAAAKGAAIGAAVGTAAAGVAGAAANAAGKVAGAASGAFSKAKGSSSKKGLIIKLVIAAVIVFALIKLIFPGSIVGTWSPTKVKLNGQTYSWSEYKRDYENIDMEFRFEKDGELIMYLDSYSVVGSWYHSSGNNYVLSGSGRNMTVKLSGGTLTYDASSGSYNVTIYFKKK